MWPKKWLVLISAVGFMVPHETLARSMARTSLNSEWMRSLRSSWTIKPWKPTQTTLHLTAARPWPGANNWSIPTRRRNAWVSSGDGYAKNNPCARGRIESRTAKLAIYPIHLQLLLGSSLDWIKSVQSFPIQLFFQKGWCGRWHEAFPEQEIHRQVHQTTKQPAN